MLYLRINEILITARVGEDFSLLKTDGGKVAKSNNKERRTNTGNSFASFSYSQEENSLGFFSTWALKSFFLFGCP